MTREEEIKQAAENNLDVSIYTPKDGEMLKETFYIGAEWADKHPVNVWHDASEEPQDKNRRILSYSEYFDCFFLDFPNYLMIKDGGVNKDWETVVLRNKMSKWAYVSDLFPKGDEK